MGLRRDTDQRNAVSTPAKTTKATAKPEPSLRFYHSKALRQKTNTVLEMKSHGIEFRTV